MTPKETLQQAMSDLGVTVDAVFVPWSESRSFKAGARVTERSLNWRVTLKRDGRKILTTDYTAGIAHAPSYKHGQRSIHSERMLAHETERGTAGHYLASTDHVVAGKPLLPDACDVVYSLVSDGDAIDHPDFESWASNLGYDLDSRKAEATYRACVEIGIKLRAALGDSGLSQIRKACEDY